jgi:hypothetical protein
VKDEIDSLIYTIDSVANVEQVEMYPSRKFVEVNVEAGEMETNSTGLTRVDGQEQYMRYETRVRA